MMRDKPSETDWGSLWVAMEGKPLPDPENLKPHEVYPLMSWALAVLQAEEPDAYAACMRIIGDRHK